MRSQKQSNRAPRPLKFNSTDHGWSGGRKHNTSQPVSKAQLLAAIQNRTRIAAVQSVDAKVQDSAASPVPPTDV
jgi:hypothetical protein